MAKNHPSLLPNGLIDLLYPHADNESRIIDVCMNEFKKFGYQRVKPPLVEFEESLLGEGPGQALARQTFRLMDPVSGRMMGVRADVTAQIARISSSRMADVPRPLRLSYAADVLRVNGTQLRPERQFCQVGCEMIGDDSIMADVEMALVAILALSSSGIKNISIDLTVPTIINNIFNALNESEDKREGLINAILKRDKDGVKKVNAKSSAIIVDLMDFGGDVKKALSGLEKIGLTDLAKNDMARLLAVANELRKALDVYGLNDVHISIDPLEHRGFEYHTGVSFSVFALGARGELGSGGRYIIGAGAQSASGFTLYMDAILKIAPKIEQTPEKKVPKDASWADVKALQDKGFLVSR